MMESASSVLDKWDVFYTLTGTSAAGLTGLMFVVITLMRDTRRRGSTDGVRTFSTPTVVHFAVALMISGILCAPWPNLIAPAAFLTIAGVGGVSYQCRLLHIALQFTEYDPDVEDWTWYTFLPMATYGLFVLGAILLATAPSVAVYAPAAGVALLILIGIHNAWDVVTYITILDPKLSTPSSGEEERPTAQAPRQ